MTTVRRLLCLAAFIVTALVVPVGVAAAAQQTPTTGQPGASSGVTCFSGPATSAPGNAMAARGSVFNPDGVSGTVYAGNPGTASLAHANSTAAVSQYDIACLRVTQH